MTLLEPREPDDRPLADLLSKRLTRARGSPGLITGQRRRSPSRWTALRMSSSMERPARRLSTTRLSREHG
jgi:hypothetical protein